jgi:ferric-dicitrate binding protein FerR (iron transport regulator)
LVYHGRPLPEVIEDVQRYLHRRIRVDAAAAGFQFSGIVKLEDVDSWLRDLPTIYPLEIVDCHITGFRREISACVDPQLLLIRSRLNLQQNGLHTTPL